MSPALKWAGSRPRTALNIWVSQMPKQPGQSDGKIPLKNFLDDLRSTLTDSELSAKYNLTARSYVKLIQVLLERKVVTEADLVQRRALAVQRDRKKESDFISGLYLCNVCGHPNTEPFDVCPACETKQSDYSGEEDENGLTTLSTTSISRQVDSFREQESNVEMVEGMNHSSSDETDGEDSSRLSSLRSFLSEKIKKKP